ncbi:hypothetical protein ACWDBD_36905 [Streptomyces sp. NPDC001118]
MQPNLSRGEAADNWEYARRHFGPDSTEAAEAAKVLEQTLTHPNDRSAEGIFAALMAAQEHRAGGAAPRGITLMVDEMAEIAARVRAGTLFPDRTPDEVREEIERLIRAGRKPSPVERERTERAGHRVTDVRSTADTTTEAAR